MFLIDTEMANFARPKGAKDKQKRKRSLLKTTAVMGLGAAGLIGAGLLGRSIYKTRKLKNTIPKSAKKGLSKKAINSEKVARRRNFIDMELMKNNITRAGEPRGLIGERKLRRENRDLYRKAKSELTKYLSLSDQKASKERIKRTSLNVRSRLGSDYSKYSPNIISF